MPKLSEDEIRANMRRMYEEMIPESIRRVGQQLIGVGSGDGTYDFPFMYTIGMHLVGRRELLLVGSLHDTIALILNDLCDRLRAEKRDFAHGEIVDSGGRVPLMALDAEHPAVRGSYLIQAGEYYGHLDFGVTQLVLPDREGRWPWDPECDAPYKDMPVLTGPRDEKEARH